MKSLIVYCSEHKKNTEKIAQIFAKITQCELVNVREVKDINLDNYHLIGFGSGVYKESMSPNLFKLVDNMNLTGKNVFVFSTSGVGMKYYNNSLIKLLELKGAINKGSFACKGYFNAKEFTNKKIFEIMSKLSQGHPNQKDYKNAERFLDKILKSLN